MTGYTSKQIADMGGLNKLISLEDTTGGIGHYKGCSGGLYWFTLGF